MDTTILPSLISAGSALAGAALQQAFSLLGKRVENKAAIQKMRREKLEELADLLNQHQLSSLEALMQRRIHPPAKSGIDDHKALDQLALRVCSLALLFFPALKELAENFLKASVGLQSALVSGTEEEMVAEAKKMTQARKAIEQAIEHYAKKLGFHG